MSASATYPAVELDGSVHQLIGDTEDLAVLGAPADEPAFKSAMGLLASGVVMVTTWHEGRPWGLTISSCCSLTLRPQQILISLRSATVSCRQALSSGRFGVSILGADQKEVAEFGAAPGQAKFIDELCADAVPPAGPAIPGALRHLDCAVADDHPVGDHTIIVGRVLQITGPPAGDADAAPLLYYDRAFRRIGGAI